MPELPEVETIARGLRTRLPGRSVVAVFTSDKPLRMLQPVDRARLLRAVGDASFAAVERWGKYLLLELSSGWSLLVHLGMTGQLGLAARGEPRAPHTHVVLTLADGEELRFRDPRRFGWIASYPRAELATCAELASLGPDPLADAFSPAALAEALRATRGCSLKAFLLDQRRLAGVGNIYASEALFRAGLHPAMPAHRLGPARAARLFAALRQVLTAAVENRGTSFRDYRDAGGARGENQFHLQVFMRDGQRCLRCGGTIRRITQQARSTFYCPGCQRR
jgi:formamidopyrimidine-DNA glycosylase